MKLRTKTTLYFTGMIAVLLTVAVIMLFFGLRQVVAEETDEGLWRSWRMIRPALDQADNPEEFELPDLRIIPLGRLEADQGITFRDTILREAYTSGWETGQFRIMETAVEIRGKTYGVQLYHSAVDSEELFSTILLIVGIVLVVFILALTFFQFFISGRLWQPFDRVLKTIDHFEITSDEALEFGKTNTKEFRRLILFLERMTEKVRRDYRNLKQFTENASHELQTPMAVIRTRLERLLQSERLNEEDAKLVVSALDMVKRLSKLNSSLLLLSKIENQQFETSTEIDLRLVIEKTLESQKELFELKEISLECEAPEKVMVPMNDMLAEVMVGNLISNAVRHNHPGGRIFVELSRQGLELRNTGSEEALPKKVFERFGKAKGGSGSVGLGLAIVKEICLRQGWDLKYDYSEGLHCFRIRFNTG